MGAKIMVVTGMSAIGKTFAWEKSGAGDARFTGVGHFRGSFSAAVAYDFFAGR
jgi:hypothetical protein